MILLVPPSFIFLTEIMKIIFLICRKSYLKLYLPALTTFLFIGCSAAPPPPSENAAAGSIKSEKNRQIALSNEITEFTQAAQKLERQGRDMESFRQWTDAESQRQCKVAMEDRQQQIKALEEKIKKFPDPFGAYLAPIIPDLNECVTCSKKAAASCVKARSSINDAIEKMYPPR